MRLSSDCCTDGSAVRLGRDEEVNRDCNIVKRAGEAIGLHCSCQRPRLVSDGLAAKYQHGFAAGAQERMAHH